MNTDVSIPLIPVRKRAGRPAGISAFMWVIIGKLCHMELHNPAMDAAAPCPPVTDAFDLVEIGIRARAWARHLNGRYDLFVGSGPAELLAANVLACRLGRSLSSTEVYLNGTAWLSSQVTERKAPSSILIIALHVAEEVHKSVEAIRTRHPDARVDIGVLLPSGNRQPFCLNTDTVDYRSKV